MRHWRDEVLQRLYAVPGPLIIAEDPDGLLLDEEIAAQLNEKQVEIIAYDDPVSFRFAFETQCRPLIESRRRRVLIRTDHSERMPYDILQQGNTVAFRVGDLFPKMAVSVIRQLNARDFDHLDNVYDNFQGTATSQETLQFIVRHVYKLPYDMMNTEADLYQWLLSLHARRDPLPAVVEQFFIEQLEAKPPYRALPVRDWVRSADAFYSHLQKEWEQYIERLQHHPTVIKEDDPGYKTDEQHPFSAPDVRRLLNDLFVEGHLQPVSGFDAQRLPVWARAGVMDDPNYRQRERLQQTIRRLCATLQHNKRYHDWLDTARLYGEMKYLFLALKDNVEERMVRAVGELERSIDDNFTVWMLKSYQGLPSLPHLPKPVMVHHVPHYLAAETFSKVALVVLDGMSVVQWAHVKEVISADFQLVENYVFSWVPTLTSVSRQALFSGKMPFYFADSLWSTHKEKHLWTRFWEDCGVSKQRIVYARNLGQGTDDEKEYLECLSERKVKVAGLVVNTIDRLTHGAIQGHEGMQAELRVWLQKGHLTQLLRNLVSAGFTVFLTSDHGNKECTGIGRVSDGVLVETKGERVTIYDDPVLYRERVAQWQAIEWPNTGLPNDCFPLIASGNRAFVREGTRVISHGGISLEEVIVPFVQVNEMR